MTGEWLPLLNFSTKHHISLSTLRRRIKANSIPYKLEQGKYFILDEETPSLRATNPAPQASPVVPEAQAIRGETARSPEGSHHHEQGLSSSSFVEASVLSSANRLVEEIKSAYAKILQEKEEQIAQLKEELVDLRMLVRILEEGASANKKPPVSQEPQAEGSSNDDFFFSDFQSREL